jgi:hypothetical protein
VSIPRRRPAERANRATGGFDRIAAAKKLLCGGDRAHGASIGDEDADSMYALRIAGKQQPGNKQRIGGFSFRKVRPILSPPPGLAGLVSAADRSIGCDSLIYVSSHYGNAPSANYSGQARAANDDHTEGRLRA